MSNSLEVYTATMLRDAVSEVFSTMVFMDIDEEAPENDLTLEGGGNVMGCISFSGNYEGALSIRLSQDCAKLITVNLLALDEDEMEPSDLPDAIGEICNMVMGALKTSGYEDVGEISVSVPTVLCGDHMVNQLRAGAVEVRTAVGIEQKYCIEINMMYAKSRANQ